MSPFRRRPYRFPSVELRLARNRSHLANFRAHLSESPAVSPANGESEIRGAHAPRVLPSAPSPKDSAAAALQSPTQPELFS